MFIGSSPGFEAVSPTNLAAAAEDDDDDDEEG